MTLKKLFEKRGPLKKKRVRKECEIKNQQKITSKSWFWSKNFRKIVLQKKGGRKEASEKKSALQISTKKEVVLIKKTAGAFGERFFAPYLISLVLNSSKWGFHFQLLCELKEFRQKFKAWTLDSSTFNSFFRVGAKFLPSYF